MSTPTMDDAAKVLADPTAYADDARLHAALTHLRANNPVAWVDEPAVPAVLGDHQARRHHGHRAGQQPVPRPSRDRFWPPRTPTTSARRNSKQARVCAP